MADALADSHNAASKPTTLSKLAHRYRGATVEDLDPPSALSCNPTDPISHALLSAFERDYTHLTVVSDTTRALLGYLSIPHLRILLDTGKVQESDEVSKAMVKFRRKGRVYKVITMDTPLEELEMFFNGGENGEGGKQEFAVVTDERRRFVLGVATRGDLEDSEQRGVLGLLPISLRRVEIAPQRLSLVREEKVISDPVFCKARAKSNKAPDAVRRAYPSNREAKNAASPHYDAYHTSSNAYKTLVRVIKNREYRAEHDKFYLKAGALVPVAPAEPPNPQHSLLQRELQISIRDFDQLLEATARSLEDNIYPALLAWNMNEDSIDPILIDRDEREDGQDEPLAIFKVDDGTRPTVINVQDRLHSIGRGYKGQCLIAGFHNETAVMRPHRWDTLFDDARSATANCAHIDEKTCSTTTLVATVTLGATTTSSNKARIGV
ncbi:hypothetical protein D0Z07_2392 [Hyphodiscus hymeniophilus]|uniref:CBS domain-containing protein n=1 Tax=Hyphodiscus hymeniophilus TaxID=353542 RepID=A0A9P6VNB5_9HELO|nr:hypothetical protein D0Z07_2392 [Hyphodiscus hymeniophilus]